MPILEGTTKFNNHRFQFISEPIDKIYKIKDIFLFYVTSESLQKRLFEETNMHSRIINCEGMSDEDVVLSIEHTIVSVGGATRVHNLNVRFGTFNDTSAKKFVIIEDLNHAADILKALSFEQLVVFVRDNDQDILIQSRRYPSITFKTSLSNNKLYDRVKSMSLEEVSELIMQVSKGPVTIDDTVKQYRDFVKVERFEDQMQNKLADNFSVIFDHIKQVGNKKVIVYNKDSKQYNQREIFRHYKSFGYTPGFKEIGKSYMFGETTGKAYMFDETKESKDTYVEPELDILKELLSWTNGYFGKGNWNLYVNAYEPEDYIELHSDCTNSIEEGSDIIIMSIYDKDSTSRCIKFVSKSEDDSFEIPLNADSIIKMDAKIQEKWRHSIDKGTGRRIGITFRRMKDTANPIDKLVDSIKKQIAEKANPIRVILEKVDEFAKSKDSLYGLSLTVYTCDKKVASSIVNELNKRIGNKIFYSRTCDEDFDEIVCSF